MGRFVKGLMVQGFLLVFRSTETVKCLVRQSRRRCGGLELFGRKIHLGETRSLRRGLFYVEKLILYVATRICV